MKAEKIEWRTYANLSVTAFPTKFACGLTGANPPPTASPSNEASHIGMEGRIAPSKPSQTNLRDWMACRADAPPVRPWHLVGAGSAGRFVSPEASDRWALWPGSSPRLPRCARPANGPVYPSLWPPRCGWSG